MLSIDMHFEDFFWVLNLKLNFFLKQNILCGAIETTEIIAPFHTIHWKHFVLGTL